MVKYLIIFLLLSNVCFADTDDGIDLNSFRNDVRNSHNNNLKKNNELTQDTVDTKFQYKYQTHRSVNALKNEKLNKKSRYRDDNKHRKFTVEKEVGRPTSVSSEIKKENQVLKPARAIAQNKVRRKKKKKHIANDSQFISPSVQSTSTVRVGFNSSLNTKKYGILINTWLDVELKRKVVSSDRGSVELYLKTPIKGRFRELKVNTVFLAKPSYNEGSNRLDLLINYVITPDDEEFVIRATAYDVNGNYGLAGSVIRDRNSEVAEAAGNAVLAVTKNVVSEVVPNGILGSGINTASNTLLQREQQYKPKAKKAVIISQPQFLRIKIEKSF